MLLDSHGNYIQPWQKRKKKCYQAIQKYFICVTFCLDFSIAFFADANIYEEMESTGKMSSQTVKERYYAMELLYFALHVHYCRSIILYLLKHLSNSHMQQQNLWAGVGIHKKAPYTKSSGQICQNTSPSPHHSEIIMTKSCKNKNNWSLICLHIGVISKAHCLILNFWKLTPRLSTARLTI